MATTYTPNATDVTQPTEDKFVYSAAAEFRALKTEVAAVRTLAGTGTGSAGSVTKQAVVDALKEGGTTTIPFVRDTVWSGAENGGSLIVTRNATYTGGANDLNGNRCMAQALTVSTTANAGTSNCEMALLGTVSSYADIDRSAQALGQAWPQNIGLGGHAFQYGNAPIWGSWIVAHNARNAPQVLNDGAIVGIEVDIGLTGTDLYQSTVGVHCFPIARATGHCSGWAAFWAGGDANQVWQDAFVATTGSYCSFFSNATGTFGMNLEGTYSIGINLASATIASGTAIRLKAGQYICMEPTDSIKFKFNDTTGLLEFFNGTTRRGYLNMGAGADVDLAGGGGGAPVGAALLTSANTFTATNIFNGTTQLNNTNMVGTFNLGAQYMNVSSTGNTRPANTSSPAGLQMRVRIDATTDLWIPLYN